MKPREAIPVDDITAFVDSTALVRVSLAYSKEKYFTGIPVYSLTREALEKIKAIKEKTIATTILLRLRNTLALLPKIKYSSRSANSITILATQA
ncbi:MAG: hypothetical protein DRJ52_08950 [Thermoprotei archaeon]|nr:MAG: hypothetical protein DRJ52_08950 [Thermoprotei archaeon]